MVVAKDLGGYFNYVVVDEDLVLVDPGYMQEYMESHPEKQSFFKRRPMLYKLIKIAGCIYAVGVVAHIIL